MTVRFSMICLCFQRSANWRKRKMHPKRSQGTWLAAHHVHLPSPSASSEITLAAPVFVKLLKPSQSSACLPASAECTSRCPPRLRRNKWLLLILRCVTFVISSTLMGKNHTWTSVCPCVALAAWKKKCFVLRGWVEWKCCLSCAQASLPDSWGTRHYSFTNSPKGTCTSHSVPWTTDLSPQRGPSLLSLRRWHKCWSWCDHGEKRLVPSCTGNVVLASCMTQEGRQPCPSGFRPYLSSDEGTKPVPVQHSHRWGDQGVQRALRIF